MATRSIKAARLADAKLAAISETYSGLDIVAAGVYPVGEWRKQVATSYQREDVPAGHYVGAYSTVALAVTGVAQEGDWYYDMDDGFFYEVDAGEATSTRIYRAGSANMPALIAVVATSSRVIIFDLTLGKPQMWMEFTAGSGYAFGNTTAHNDVAFDGSRLYLVDDSGLFYVDFADDFVRYTNATQTRSTSQSIAGRHTAATFGDYYTSATEELVDAVANSVATYVPDNPTVTNDSGVAVPYVLVGTDGGVSQIDPDGTVYDITNSKTNDDVASVAFIEDGAPDIVFAAQDSDSDTSYYLLHRSGLLTADVTAAFYFQATDVLGMYNAGAGSNEIDPGVTLNTSGTTGYVEQAGADNEFYFGDSNQFTRVILNATTPTESIVAYTQTDHTTGWMKGNIKGSWIGEVAAGSITTSITDNSGIGNDLNVVGTLTSQAVATGAELNELDGFSTSNYLEASAGMDGITTGDFCFYGWCDSQQGGSFQTLLDRVNAGSKQIQIGRNNSGSTDDFRIIVGGSGARNSGITTTGTVFWVLQRNGANCEFYINGVQVDTFANSDDLTDATAQIRIGLSSATTTPWLNGISLVRFSFTALTQADIDRIYRDELQLFQENTNCTLYDTTDGVTGLARDSVTDEVHVSTADGVSVFRDLVRTDTYTGDGVVAAYDGFRVAEDASSTYITRAEANLRELKEQAVAEAVSQSVTEALAQVPTPESGTIGYTAQTTGTTLTGNSKTLADTSSAAVAYTLPTGVVGEFVKIQDTGSAATNNITLTPQSGEKVEGVADALYYIDVDAANVELIYTSANGWILGVK